MSDSVHIQLRFKRQTAQGEYNDCLLLTPAEYAAVTEPEIEARKQARVDNWIASLKAAQDQGNDPVEQAKRNAEEKLARLDDIKQKLVSPDEGTLALIDAIVDLAKAGKIKDRASVVAELKSKFGAS